MGAEAGEARESLGFDGMSPPTRHGPDGCWRDYRRLQRVALALVAGPHRVGRRLLDTTRR